MLALGFWLHRHHHAPVHQVLLLDLLSRKNINMLLGSTSQFLHKVAWGILRQKVQNKDFWGHTLKFCPEAQQSSNIAGTILCSLGSEQLKHYLPERAIGQLWHSLSNPLDRVQCLSWRGPLSFWFRPNQTHKPYCQAQDHRTFLCILWFDFLRQWCHYLQKEARVSRASQPRCIEFLAVYSHKIQHDAHENNVWLHSLRGSVIFGIFITVQTQTLFCLVNTKD